VRPALRDQQLGGLTAAEVRARRQRYGENVLPTVAGPTVWSILLDQFKSPLVYIILVAGAISLVAGERTDALLILAVVVIDVAVGFVQEYQAQRSYSALRGLLRPMTTVIRDGERQEVEVREVVPGDLVALNAGDRIPADGEILQSARLSANEAILTGESEAVPKSEAPEQNQVFMGTVVLAGRGLMRVTRTGTAAQLGQIAAGLSEAQEEETPLRSRLRRFSRWLAVLVLGITVLVLISTAFALGNLLEAVRVAIVLAIAAVPEALLIAVTLILVLGSQAILRRNGLVRRLSAVETLGSVTVICTDKTGTLTEGRLRVTRAALADRERALQVMVFCNNRESSLELALWTYAEAELGQDPRLLADRAERLAEEPFSSETKYMMATVRLASETLDCVKGAPEVVLGICRVAGDERAAIAARVEEWAGEGLKPLGLAYQPRDQPGLAEGCTWAGLVAMEDPVREGVPEAVASAQRAGIKVKMITGDYQRTAQHVARNIGLDAAPEQIMEGSTLESLDDQALEARVEDTVIFSRIKPHDKLRIVRALQAHGEVTAMVGDGVNDAPALQRANIGVAVGTGSDVAKEAGDLILLDDNFRTIVLAVEQGRIIFENVRKVVSFTMSNSLAAVLAIVAAQLLGFPQLLTVPQILWIHLIADGPPDIVLGFEPQEPGIMQESPKPLSEPVLPALGVWLAVAISMTSAAVAIALFAANIESGGLARARSLAFGVFAVDAMVYIFAYRSLRRSILRIGPVTHNKALIGAVLLGLSLAVGAIAIPLLRNALGLVPLSARQWALIFALSFGLLIVVEMGKSVNAWLGERR
jgi:Ca2+-transporting ATPase